MIRIKIVFYFILYSITQRTYPWRFFQINAKYFNESKGIFSKFEIEKNIPKKWKLKDCLLNPQNKISVWRNKINNNFNFPIFLKPEWGQNSEGIYRVDEKKHLNEVLKKIKKQKITYICQQLADYEKEYEILYVRSKNNEKDFSIFSITETINTTGESYPIGGINSGCIYKEVTNKFSKEEIKKISTQINTIGNFPLARVGLKANNIRGILNGNFKVFEINIFIPFCLNLLDETISKENRNEFLKKFVKELALATKKVGNRKAKDIFWNMTRRHYKIKFNIGNIG